MILILLQIKSSRFPLTALFFFNDTATTEIYTLSLHDALPISRSAASIYHDIKAVFRQRMQHVKRVAVGSRPRSEEHTSELQSPCNLVCRLLLEKKNICFPPPFKSCVAGCI